MQTKVIVPASGITHDPENSLFNEFLRLEGYPHYPGKIIVSEDTIFTSTFGRYPVKARAVFLPKQAQLLEERIPDDGHESIFYKTGNKFVYRTIVPEEDFEQYILVDRLSADSAKIVNSFSQNETSNIILP